MPLHLSARLVWHDRGWDGCICDNPKLNVSCVMHEHIREERNEDVECTNSKKHVSKLKLNELPPCSRDIATFSSKGFTILHKDPLEWRNLPPVEEELPPYSFCTAPYERMLSEDQGETWISDPKIQLEKLKNFWQEIVPSKSLIFFYVNYANPLEEDRKKRILIGISRVSHIGRQKFFGKKSGYKENYPVWSRCITHSFPEQGVRLPYQEYIKNGYDVSEIICYIPASAKRQFSYVAEHVTDDTAVGIIERAIQSIETIVKDNKIKEPYGKSWQYRLKWLNKVLEEVWKNRGVFPGVGSVLEALGFENGVIYHRMELTSLESKGMNIHHYVFSILDGKRKRIPKKYYENYKKAMRKWKKLPKIRKELLKILCRFALSPEQIKRVSNREKRKEAFIDATERELIENPYIISELDDGDSDSPPTDFETIDRGMILNEKLASNFKKIDFEYIDKDDERRVRALLVQILKEASTEGHTCISVYEAFKRIKRRLPKNRLFELDLDIILHNRKFYEEQLVFIPRNNPKFIALKSLYDMEKEVEGRIKNLLKGKYDEPSDHTLKKLIENELRNVKRLENKSLEDKARQEKIEALRALFSNRLSVIMGRAGTGKTTVLKPFIKGLEELEGKTSLLLLAPTGKARVRLQSITGRKALTIHEFLMKQGWIREETYSLKNEGGSKGVYENVIIDEASMIPIDLLATLFRALDFNYIKRLVLVGDPNQLPPIGPGRPFIDIIDYLEENGKEHVICLTQRVRHEGSDALKLADFFLREKGSPGDDEILSKIAKRSTSKELEVYFWNDEKELYEILEKNIMNILYEKKNGEPLYQRFNESLKNPENWQIISPTRLHFFGTTEINRIIQEKYNRGLFMQRKYLGEQQIMYTDKVIQIINKRTKGKEKQVQIINGNGQYSDYVANGEIGRVVKLNKEKKFLEVEFSTHPNIRFRYYGKNVIDENLELAYAITVHKSQGSDFDVVIFIVPQKTSTLSTELLYTGLTRFRRKIILLIEKDILPLLTYRNLQYSQTLKRNTNLFKLKICKEPFKPEQLKHVTRKGELVRSKSEVIIANILADLGISYEYEKPLYSKNDPLDYRLPDFTIKYQGKTFYWEHLGMLNDPDYIKDWKRKERWYKENGYYKQLIVSKERPDGSIDSQEIEHLAKERILKSR